MSTISVSGTTEVDFEEEIEIEDLSDRELKDCLKEAAKRGLVPDPAAMGEREYVEGAYRALLGGRKDEAICYLERALWPSSAFKESLTALNAFRQGVPS